MNRLMTCFFLFFAAKIFAQIELSNKIIVQDMNGIQKTNYSSEINTKTSISTYSVSSYFDSIRPLYEINTPNYADAYPWISSDGLRLYFTSGSNNNKLMMAQRSSIYSFFGLPSVVQFFPANPNSYWLSNNELDVYACCGAVLYYAHRNSVAVPFGMPTQLAINSPSIFTSINGPSLNQAQNKLYMYCTVNWYSIGILEFSRTTTTSFSYDRTLPIMPTYTINPGQLSKNELSMFFSASNVSGQSSLFEFVRQTPTDTFNVNSLYEIQINNPNLLNNQPSFTDSCKWIVFAGANVNSWGANDLYIAKKTGNAQVKIPEISKSQEFGVSLFPNPATNIFNFKFSNFEDQIVNISIYNLLGDSKLNATIKTKNSECSLNTCSLVNGVYFININNSKQFNKTIKVLVEK